MADFTLTALDRALERIDLDLIRWIMRRGPVDLAAATKQFPRLSQTQIESALARTVDCGIATDGTSWWNPLDEKQCGKMEPAK